DEDALDAIGVEVGGVALEGDEAAVGRHGRWLSRQAGEVVALRAVRGDAHSCRRLPRAGGLRGSEEHEMVGLLATDTRSAGGNHETLPVYDRCGIRRERRAVAGQLAPAEPEDAQDRLENRAVLVLVLSGR